MGFDNSVLFDVSRVLSDRGPPLGSVIHDASHRVLLKLALCTRVSLCLLLFAHCFLMPFWLKVICDSEKYVPCMVAELVLIDCNNKYPSSARWRRQ